MSTSEDDLPELLRQASVSGDSAAYSRLYHLIEGELRKMAHSLMSRQKPGHLLQTTVLVNEAFVRLLNTPNPKWENRTDLFRIACAMMKQVLIDYSRRRRPDGFDSDHAALLADDRSPPIDHSLEVEESLAKLAVALDELEGEDPDAAKAFFLCFFHRLPQADEPLTSEWLASYPESRRKIQEIATEQGWSRSSAYRILGRALTSLQEKMN